MKILYLIAALLTIAIVYDVNRKLGALLATITILSMYLVYRRNK